MLHTLTRRTLLGVYAVMIVVPLLVVVLGSFKTLPQLFASPFGLPPEPNLDNYSTVLGRGGLSRAFLNSVIVTSTSVFSTLLLASLAAFAYARIPGRFAWLMFGFFVLGMAVPAQAAMIPQYVLLERMGLLNSLLGLAVVNIAATLPVAVFILGGFMRALPRELFEAASVDGAGALRSYRSIAMPLAAPALATTAIFLFVMHWNDLLYPLLFIQSRQNRTLPLALLDFQGEFLTQYPLLFTGVIIASLPIVIAYVFLQRFFVAGLTAGSTR